jgi:hypothetical protein
MKAGSAHPSTSQAFSKMGGLVKTPQEARTYMRPFAQVQGILRISNREVGHREEGQTDLSKLPNSQSIEALKTEQSKNYNKVPTFRLEQAELGNKLHERVNVKSSFLSRFTNSELASRPTHTYYGQRTTH